jgi:hypothetical protein
MQAPGVVGAAAGRADPNRRTPCPSQVWWTSPAAGDPLLRRLGTGLAAARGTLPGPSSACPWVSTWWGVVPRLRITRTGVWNAGKTASVPISSVMATEIDTALRVPRPTLNTSPAGAEMAGTCAPATFTLNDANLPAKSTLSGTWITPTGSGSCRDSARWGGQGGAIELRSTFDGNPFHVTFAPRKRFARFHLVIAFAHNLSCSVPGAGGVYFGPSNSPTTTFVTRLLRVPVAALVHDRAFALTAAVKLTHTDRWNGGTETQKLVLAGRIRFVPTGCNTLTSLSQQPRKVC